MAATAPHIPVLLPEGGISSIGIPPPHAPNVRKLMPGQRKGAFGQGSAEAKEGKGTGTKTTSHTTPLKMPGSPEWKWRGWTGPANPSEEPVMGEVVD